MKEQTTLKELSIADLKSLFDYLVIFSDAGGKLKNLENNRNARTKIKSELQSRINNIKEFNNG